MSKLVVYSQLIMNHFLLINLLPQINSYMKQHYQKIIKNKLNFMLFISFIKYYREINKKKHLL